MNGPPTPPPSGFEPPSTSSSVNPTVAAHPFVVLSSPVTHAAFLDIAALAIQNQFHGLIAKAEGAELYPSADNHPSRLLVIAPLVLSYLIIDDLSPARDALLRLPEVLAAHPLSQALFNLLSAVWERKYERVYSRVNQLLETVSKPDFFDAPLASVMKGLSDSFLAAFRQRAMSLIAKAYTSIPLSLVQTYLGFSATAALDAAKQGHWAYNASHEVLNRLPPKTDLSPSPLSAPSSLNTFSLVIDGVAKLEA